MSQHSILAVWALEGRAGSIFCFSDSLTGFVVEVLRFDEVAANNIGEASNVGRHAYADCVEAI